MTYNEIMTINFIFIAIIGYLAFKLWYCNIRRGYDEADKLTNDGKDNGTMVK